MKILKHILKYIFLVTPLRIAGTIILIPVSYRYKLGQFPKSLRWFDDYRGYMIKQHGVSSIDTYGAGHCDLFHKYDSTWYGRYIWSAWRNSTNYFKNVTLGATNLPERLFITNIQPSNGYTEVIDTDSGKIIAWEYAKYNGNEVKIPCIPYGIRLRLGYKIGDIDYVRFSSENGYPLEFAFSIGIRSLDRR